MEPVEVVVELEDAMIEPLDLFWHSWMQRPLHIQRDGNLVLRLRLQTLWIIVGSRIRQSKQHEQVSSSKCRGTVPTENHCKVRPTLQSLRNLQRR